MTEKMNEKELLEDLSKVQSDLDIFREKLKTFGESLESYFNDVVITPPAPKLEKRFDYWNKANLVLNKSPNPEFVIKDIFFTKDGKVWPNQGLFELSDWAFREYIQGFYFPEIGGSHHMFGCVLDKDNNFVKDIRITFTNHLFTKKKLPGNSGWANEPTYDNFNPEHTRGVTKMLLDNVEADELVGLGKYYGWRVSTFVVWQEV